MYNEEHMIITRTLDVIKRIDIFVKKIINFNNVVNITSSLYLSFSHSCSFLDATMN